MMTWSKPAWLDAATSPTATVPEEVTARVYGAHIAGPSGAVAYLEGSMDGTNWFVLIRVEVGASLESAFSWAIETPVRLIRAHLVDAAGGASTVGVIATS